MPARRGAFVRRTSPHAKALRHNKTAAEEALWAKVRNRQIEGFKFRSQVTIEPYIVDFLCLERGLIVEVDGSQHLEQVDWRRTACPEEQGYRVIRFWNNDVLGNIDAVLEALRAALLTGPHLGR